MIFSIIFQLSYAIIQIEYHNTKVSYAASSDCEVDLTNLKYTINGTGGKFKYNKGVEDDKSLS